MHVTGGTRYWSDYTPSGKFSLLWSSSSSPLGLPLPHEGKNVKVYGPVCVHTGGGVYLLYGPRRNLGSPVSERIHSTWNNHLISLNSWWNSSDVPQQLVLPTLWNTRHKVNSNTTELAFNLRLRANLNIHNNQSIIWGHKIYYCTQWNFHNM